MCAKASGIIGRTKYYTEITAGNHTIISDEPVWNGGAEKGPDPFELLASSLVACTCATLRMYIDRKEWNVDKIHAEVSFERDLKSEVTIFTREISFEGEITEEQRARLLVIANKCPVHQLLTRTIEVQTILKQDGIRTS